MPFEVVAERWHDFYVLAGTSAATLVGLLFVGLSLHLRVVVTHAEVRGLARITLANFGLILVISLFLVIRQSPTAASTELLFSGAISLGLVAPSIVRAIRTRAVLTNAVQLVARFTFSVAGYAGVVVAGVLIRRGVYPSAFTWLVVVTVLLIVVSLRNSWDLLVRVAEIPFNAADRGDA